MLKLKNQINGWTLNLGFSWSNFTSIHIFSLHQCPDFSVSKHFYLFTLTYNNCSTNFLIISNQTAIINYPTKLVLLSVFIFVRISLDDKALNLKWIWFLLSIILLINSFKNLLYLFYVYIVDLTLIRVMYLVFIFHYFFQTP